MMKTAFELASVALLDTLGLREEYERRRADGLVQNKKEEADAAQAPCQLGLANGDRVERAVDQCEEGHGGEATRGHLRGLGFTSNKKVRRNLPAGPKQAGDHSVHNAVR